MMFEHIFSEGKWQYFLKRILVMSALYGVFMAGYYKFIKKQYLRYYKAFRIICTQIIEV